MPELRYRAAYIATRPLDLAQPFVPPAIPADVHPPACDCPAHDETSAASSPLASAADLTAIICGGVIAGQLLGRALDALGVLALLGIG